MHADEEPSESIFLVDLFGSLQHADRARRLLRAGRGHHAPAHGVEGVDQHAAGLQEQQSVQADWYPEAGGPGACKNKESPVRRVEEKVHGDYQGKASVQALDAFSLIETSPNIYHALEFVFAQVGDVGCHCGIGDIERVGESRSDRHGQSRRQQGRASEDS